MQIKYIYKWFNSKVIVMKNSVNFLQSILTNSKKVTFIINNNTLKQLYRKILKLYKQKFDVNKNDETDKGAANIT